jgi:hypothetical protein
MNFNHDTGTILSLVTIDTTVAPPINPSAQNILTIVGNGALILPVGAIVDRPSSPAAGMFRYQTDGNVLEYYNGTVWTSLSIGGGTVTSVDISASSGGITITGNPITSSGTINLTLDSDLLALANTTTTGLYTVTGTGTSATRSIQGSTGNIVVTNGDGVSGNPVIDLANIGTPVANSFVKITTDIHGRVTATSAVTTSDITALVDSTYVNVNGDTLTGTLTFIGGATITGIPTPVNSTDVVNKAYVDGIAQGMQIKQACNLATTGNIDLSNAPSTIDGVSPSNGNRILVRAQTNAADNGIYIYNGPGNPLTRATDYDTAAEVQPGDFVFVIGGNTLATTSWVQTQDVTTLGTDSILFNQFSGPGVYVAGVGLDLTGNIFNVKLGAGITELPNDEVGVHIYNYTGSALGFSTSGGVRVATEAAAVGGDLLYVFLDGTTLEQSGSGLKFRDSVGMSVVGRINNTPGPVQDIQAGSDYQILRRSGTTIGFGSINLSQTAAVGTSVLQVGNGGTGLSVLGAANTFLSVNPGGSAYEYKTLQTSGSGQTISFASGTATFTLDTDLQALADTTTTGIYTITGAGTSATRTITGTTNRIDVTNGSGVSGNPTVDIAATYAGQASITTLGTITTGTWNATPIQPAYGGTGLTSLGGANTVLGVNGAGTAAEYKTLVGGIGITVVHGAGTITLSTSETLDLYRENPSTPTTPLATGTNAIALGSNSTSSATEGFAVGNGSNARVFGMKAYANGEFASAGDAQMGIYVLRNETTDNTATELFLDGTGGTQRLIVINNSVYTFDILVAARRTDATGGGAGYRFVGVIRKDTTPGSTTFVGTPSKTVIGETDGPWDANVVADTINGSLRINVTGQNGKTIRWVATVRTTEVTN